MPLLFKHKLAYKLLLGTLLHTSFSKCESRETKVLIKEFSLQIGPNPLEPL